VHFLPMHIIFASKYFFLVSRFWKLRCPLDSRKYGILQLPPHMQCLIYRVPDEGFCDENHVHQQYIAHDTGSITFQHSNSEAFWFLNLSVRCKIWCQFHPTEEFLYTSLVHPKPVPVLICWFQHQTNFICRAQTDSHWCDICFSARNNILFGFYCLWVLNS
jgi:hypothetical protein